MQVLTLVLARGGLFTGSGIFWPPWRDRLVPLHVAGYAREAGSSGPRVAADTGHHSLEEGCTVSAGYCALSRERSEP